MYEAVHARPDGESTVARQALTASEYGYEGIVVRNHGDAPAGFDPAVIRETYGIDVVSGVEIHADDPSTASGYLGSHRETATVVAVHGGDPAINRYAVEQPAVDVLAHPMAGDGDVNHVIARTAAENGVHLEISLRGVLRGAGGGRVRRLQAVRKLRELIVQEDAPYVLSADPRSHLQLRAPRELVAVGEVIGFDAEQVEGGLDAWGELADRNRQLQDDRFVAPGVRRRRVEGDPQQRASPDEQSDETPD